MVFKLLLALALVAVLVVSGCAQPTAAPTTAPTSTPTATATGTPTTPPKTTAQTGPYGDLRVGVASFGGEIWDPVRETQTGVAYRLAPMYDYLVQTAGLDPTNKGIAEKWSLSEDGQVMTFNLRRGIKFSNGEELNAQDVKFSLERYMSKDAIYTYLRDMIDRVEIADDNTLKVYTKGPQPYFLPWTSSYPGHQGMVLPKDYYQQVGDAKFNLDPVGSGPWKPVNYVPGDMVEYEAVANHWRQTPAFKRLQTIMIPESTTRMALLKTGGLDAIEIAVDDVGEVEAAGLRTAIMAVSVAHVNLLGSYDKRAAGMPAADIRVRQALSLAINRAEIGSTYFEGKLGPPTPPCYWTNQPDVDNEYWEKYAANIYRYDPEEAKKLLKEAGYPNGFNIKLYTFTAGGSPYLPKLAEIIQGYWDKIGVKALIVPTDFGVFKTMRTARPDRSPVDELVGQSFTFGADGSHITPKALQTYFQSKGAFNLLTGGIAEMDKLIDDAFVETNDAKRREIIAKATKLAIDSYVSAVIGTVPTIAAMGPKVDFEFPTGALSIPKYAETAKHR